MGVKRRGVFSTNVFTLYRIYCWYDTVLIFKHRTEPAGAPLNCSKRKRKEETNHTKYGIYGCLNWGGPKSSKYENFNLSEIFNLSTENVTTKSD